MYECPITYTNFDGQTVTEPHYFHLNKLECVKLDAHYEGDGGLIAHMKNLIEKAKEKKSTVSDQIEFVETLIQRSYGVRTPDGKKFLKSPELLSEFMQTEAYATLVYDILGGDIALDEFVKKAMPPVPDADVKAAIKEFGLEEDMAALNAMQTEA